LEGSLGTLNVKSINGSSVYAKTGIGTINVVELSDALVAAGFVPTDDGNPFAAGAFTPTVLIKSIKASNFANSAIAAAQIGKAQLGNVNTSNGGKLFGIWAHESLGSVKMGKKKLDSSELNGLAVDDFRVKRQ
jgi:hypothetical protein